jgi:hypothetical protein
MVLNHLMRVGPQSSRPAYPRHFAQVLQRARSPGQGLLAKCLVPTHLKSGGGIGVSNARPRGPQSSGLRQPPGQLPRSQVLSQLHWEMRDDLREQDLLFRIHHSGSNTCLPESAHIREGDDRNHRSFPRSFGDATRCAEKLSSQRRMTGVRCGVCEAAMRRGHAPA